MTNLGKSCKCQYVTKNWFSTMLLVYWAIFELLLGYFSLLLGINQSAIQTTREEENVKMMSNDN